MTASPTQISRMSRSMPISALGRPSRLPRFRWQQPIKDMGTPPNEGLSEEESRNGFFWGKDSILPYQVIEDYDRAQAPGEMPLVRIGNGLMEIEIAPQFGGRLMRLYDVGRKRELVFANPVFQPANLAALNAWFSGGIEWNGLVPGHTPVTATEVFCGIVETARGPVLRIYEFDRVVEATWQVDLFLPAGEDKLYVHGRIVNSDPVAKRAYWWTNVAAPQSPGTRVVGPAAYGIEHVLPDNHLARLPFPDPARFDGSYPQNWRSATSVFLRAPEGRRRYISALDAAGVGLAQTATSEMAGRKFFFFGTAAGGQHWMDYLSRPGEGDYLEIQSGIMPTQNQRFDLPAESSIEWTEVYGALEADPAKVHDTDYAVAEAAVSAAIAARFPESELSDVDAFLREVAQQPVTTRLSEGAPWGGRHERLTGRALSAGLDFTVSTPRDLWDDIADGRPGAAADRVPAEIAVSPLWCDAIAKSAAAAPQSFVYPLLLSVAALDREDRAAARTHLAASLALQSSWLGQRQRALLADSVEEAAEAYRLAMADPDAPDELAVEIAAFLMQHKRMDDLAALLSGLPERVLSRERIILARAASAAERGDAAELETLLGTHFATIREGEVLPEELWKALQQLKFTAAGGAGDFAQWLKSHPAPEHLVYRMHEEK